MSMVLKYSNGTWAYC